MKNLKPFSMRLSHLWNLNISRDSEGRSNIQYVNCMYIHNTVPCVLYKYVYTYIQHFESDRMTWASWLQDTCKIQAGLSRLRMKWLSVCVSIVFCGSLSESDSDVTDGWNMSRASLLVTHRLPFPNGNFQSYTSNWRRQSVLGVGFLLKSTVVF